MKSTQQKEISSIDINIIIVCMLFSNVNNEEILVADIQEKAEAQKKFTQSIRLGQAASATVEAR